MKIKRKIIFILATVIALSICTISWAISTFAFLDINVTDDPDYAPTLVNNIYKLDGTFTVSQGKAQKIEGIKLYQINLGAKRFSDQIRINLLLTNPEEMDAVLNNPKSYIDLGVWYEAPSGTVYNGDTESIRKLTTYENNEIIVKRDTTPSAIKMITQMNGNVLLMPKIADQQKLFILASITIPGGAPPGQQPPPGSELKFHIDVRM